jgi:hypothetical protein
VTGSIVEVGKLLGVVRDALIATIGLSVLFSVGIVGVVRTGERQGRSRLARLGYAVVSTFCICSCAALVVLGVALLASK